jgi:hypothetical protein
MRDSARQFVLPNRNTDCAERRVPRVSDPKDERENAKNDTEQDRFCRERGNHLALNVRLCVRQVACFIRHVESRREGKGDVAT